MQKNHKFVAVAVFLSVSLALSGCAPIFQKKKNPYLQVQLTMDQIQPNTIYVKNGTRFVKAAGVKPISVTSTNGRKTNILAFGKDITLVPDLYKGESLVFASKDAVNTVSVTRYKEVGWSAGFYSLTQDNDGNWDTEIERGTYENSDAFSQLKSQKNEQVRLKSINSKPILPDNVTDIGCVGVLERDKPYNFEYYIGTYYGKLSTVADTFFLKEFEYYSLENPEATKNGYTAFSMPEDAKSGWYYINGQGAFKYYDFEKGDRDLANVMMNEAYYTDAMQMEDAYSQKFSATLYVNFKEVSFSIAYDASQTANNNSDYTGETASMMGAIDKPIGGHVYAPDGTAYDMKVDGENDRLLLSLDEAMAGKWIIYVTPKNLIVKEPEVVSNITQQKVTTESKELIMADSNNVMFEVRYSGADEVYGVIIAPDGTTYQLENSDKKIGGEKEKVLRYYMPYVKGGNYSVKVYHYSETKIDSVEAVPNAANMESSVITVTE